MKKLTECIKLNGITGQCGNREVFLGFAQASLLYRLSFADTLNDVTGEGYQRPFNKQHSLHFQKYIVLPGSSTISLTFNLRKNLSHLWHIKSTGGNNALLVVSEKDKCLSQVDCQHRLGYLGDFNISLAFMAFINLDLREEMAMFTIINSKYKGLSTSLTDYHDSNLIDELILQAPHLYITRKLNEDPSSPWFRLVRYGGESTSGLKRRTSFRMMQRVVLQFCKDVKKRCPVSIEDMYEIITSFWKAIQSVFPNEWLDHRHNLISKGVGLYSLMMLLRDIVQRNPNASFGIGFFEAKLLPLKCQVDWSSKGTFAALGGQKGAKVAYKLLVSLLER